LKYNEKALVGPVSPHFRHLPESETPHFYTKIPREAHKSPAVTSKSWQAERKPNEILALSRPVTSKSRQAEVFL